MESLTARDTEKNEIFSHSHADPDVYDEFFLQMNTNFLSISVHITQVNKSLKVDTVHS